jgi:D-glycero-alpha-D-manno-heptose-7-phosphate kinase
MIITRSPLRISLGGGGTDLPSYYREHGGFLVAAAIDRYVYITLHETFVEECIIKYSQMERVLSLDAIAHPLIREALRLTSTPTAYLEIASMSDIPAGTGLGSSGSFTTALLHALHVMNREIVTKDRLAQEACHIEIDVLRETVGKQDQYIAAYGGITSFAFNPDDTVSASPVRLDTETRANLQDNLVLFFTGYTRSASKILSDQDQRTKDGDRSTIDGLHYVKELGRASHAALESGDLRRFAELMHEHWEHKRKRPGGMSNPQIDAWYEIGRRHGALGGKIIGAGGGGFLMFYTEEKSRLRRGMLEAGLKEVRLNFDFQGTTVVTSN